MDKQDLPPHIEDTPTDTEKTAEKTKKGVLSSKAGVFSLCCSIIACLTIAIFIIWFNIQAMGFTIQIHVLCFYLAENAKALAKTTGISPSLTILFSLAAAVITIFLLILWISFIVITILLAASFSIWRITGKVPDLGSNRFMSHSGVSSDDNISTFSMLIAGSSGV